MRYPELPDRVKEIPSQSAETEHICRLPNLILDKCTLSTRLIYLSEYLFVCTHAPFLTTKCLNWLYSINANTEIKIKWNEKIGKCKYTWKIMTKRKKTVNMQSLGSTWVPWKGILFHQDYLATLGKNGNKINSLVFTIERGPHVGLFATLEIHLRPLL